MKDYEKNLCYYFLDKDIWYFRLKTMWEGYKKMYEDEISVAYELFYEYLEVLIYNELGSLRYELGGFVLDVIQSLNYSEMGDFIIDFF